MAIRILIIVVALLTYVQFAVAACSDCSGSSATCGSGTTVAQVNTCLGTLADEGTITFASGNYTWNGTINLPTSKGFNLIGAGAGSSIVNIAGGTLNGEGITVDKTIRISGFTFDGASGGTATIFIYSSPNTLDLTKLRIDNNTFSGNSSGAISILLGTSYSTGSGNTYGSIDNNTFSGTTASFMGIKNLGKMAWVASTKGTANALFIEDNNFDFATNTDLGSGCIDTWLGASTVFRYNTTKNCLVTAHGVVHGGPMVFEAYGNTLTRTASSGGWEDGTRLIHHQGSGEIFIYDNTFTSVSSKSSTAIGLTHYRSATPEAAGYSSPYDRCDGDSAIGDGNTSPTGTYYGYPCYHQPGRDKDLALSPVYTWNNKWSDTSAIVPLAIENPWGATSPSVATHLVANRDYYDAVSANAQTSATSPFNGTTGMGYGTIANRPTTCTTAPVLAETGSGVGYWATDENKLYRCSATNTWTLQYEPYTYPHPLRGEADETPPTVSSVTIASNGTSLVIVFSENITATDNAAFTVDPTGADVTVDCPAVETATNTMTCVISRAIQYSEIAVYGYTGTNVVDTSANALATISNTPSVINNSTVGIPSIPGHSGGIFGGCIFH